MGFIDRYSWRCLLGPTAKDIEINEDFASWVVGQKRHVVFFNEMDLAPPFNFHYVNTPKIFNGKITKDKNVSICLEIEKTLDLSGKDYRHIRNSINRTEKRDLILLDNYRDIKDVEVMIKKWSDISGEKYFRDFSAKTRFFYQSNFHIGCVNLFCYDGDDLIGFGSLSPPVDGHSSYVVGKSLKEYAGAAEFIDITLYRKMLELGCKVVNLGRCGTKNLLFYKSKFRGSYEEISYNGSVR